ncbi:hypothetical protein QZH41_006374 [Actinostola sp. cb2023]|nr:hypothetical protein QZH41_006374 [Actinostola sp. cb2023]
MLATVDQDIKAIDVNTCHVNANCTNTDGSYTCKCKAGYHGDGRTCTDINECSSGGYKCHVNASCTNTDGSYTCECKPGYHGDGRTCIEPCENGVAIGMQIKTIPDQYITASSSNGSNSKPSRARLGLSGGWSASARDQIQWLQVNVDDREILNMPVNGKRRVQIWKFWLETTSLVVAYLCQAAKPSQFSSLISHGCQFELGDKRC